MLADLDARLPRLANWMKGAKPGQLWNYNLRLEPDDRWFFKEDEPLEATLETLCAAAPARLDGKRREFRGVQTAAEMLGLQVELAFAAKLVRHGVPFDFGAAGTPQPDLVLRDLNLGIELTAKKGNTLSELKYHLARAFSGAKPRVNLSLSFSAVPHAIRTKVRDDLTEEIRQAVADGEREVYCVVRPSKPGEPVITVRVNISRGGSYFPHIYVDESAHRDDLAVKDAKRAIVGAMEDKRKKRQGQAMPTLLLVDLSDIRHARQRSNATWIRELSKELTDQHVFVGLGIVYASWWRRDVSVAIAENQDADPSALKDLRALGQALRLRLLMKMSPHFLQHHAYTTTTTIRRRTVHPGAPRSASTAPECTAGPSAAAAVACRPAAHQPR